jgi:hypothetical protein
VTTDPPEPELRQDRSVEGLFDLKIFEIFANSFGVKSPPSHWNSGKRGLKRNLFVIEVP